VKQPRVTRRTAISIVVFLLLVQVSLANVLPASRVFATTAPIAIAAIVSIIAYIGIPPNESSEARKRTDEAIKQYVLVQDSTEHQRNTVIDRMRQEAPQALYSSKEVSKFLRDRTNEAKRYAGLASVQWQWPNCPRPAAMDDYPFQEITPAPREKQRSTGYFQELLDLLCNPARKFEHYHVIDTMWGMSGHLQPEQMRQLCERVCDEVNCQPTPEHQSAKWSSFVSYVKDTCAKRSGERDHHP
jgi:hypothetical protein